MSRTVGMWFYQMTHGGGGSKIEQKSVTYYLNAPLMHACVYFIALWHHHET